MRATAALVAKHVGILVLAILVAAGAMMVYAMTCMFGDEVEMVCTDDRGRFVGGVTFLSVAAFFYAIWGVVRLTRSTLTRT
jgi:hypothetical protein